MIKLRAMFLLVVIALALAATPQARAWGCEGHETIALIAEKHLNSNALSMANQILTNNPIDPTLHRFCDNTGLDLMANSATWADDYRDKHPETAGWHFFDIPRGASKTNIDQFCDPTASCVAKALTDQVAVLKNPASTGADKGNALRFIIHFAGDIHQPLHDTTNNDRGANCVPVKFFNTKPVASGSSYKPNLHAVWDTDMIENLAKGQTVDQFAAALDQQFQSQVATWQAAGINFDDWAWDAHELAETVAYGKLNKKIPIETPVAINTCADDNNVGARMLKLKEKVDAKYQTAATPVIDEQLAKAGVRLAMILNQVWP
ncbi:MAG: S1/P1 nuclease [Candidatus Acidiferrales bacterium]